LPDAPLDLDTLMDSPAASSLPTAAAATIPADDRGNRTQRILLLATPATYGTQRFAAAAQGLELEVVYGMDLPDELAARWRATLPLDFQDVAAATARIVDFAQSHPLHAILAIDDRGAVLAAEASAALGLRHNAPEAALAARNKLRMRQRLAAGGVPCPMFQVVDADVDPTKLAHQVAYPCVVKPLLLSGSRGVIRADDPDDFVRAVRRLVRLLPPLDAAMDSDARRVLIEEFIPGNEVALEGLLVDGVLHVLALFDKPDPLDGPFFEETIYVTPSRLPPNVQRTIAGCAQRAADALGLYHGPVHAELRINAEGPWIIEAAGRSIGGLCSGVLQFGIDTCLEELVLRNAVGLELGSLQREGRAAGVMMIPIPRPGILRDVRGIEEAKAVPGIKGVEITARLNYPLVPLPEGESYLGFIFSRADAPAEAEAALREAHRHLVFHIEEQLPVIQA
jgi:biotin carboxylase